MNIISSKEEINRITDGIHTLLSLPEEEFDLCIEYLILKKDEIAGSLDFIYLTDPCEAPYNPIQTGIETTLDENLKFISRGYYGFERFSMNEILKKCQSMLNNYPEDSMEYSRINRLLHSRDLSSFKTAYSNIYDVNPVLLDKLFEMLSNDDMLSNFLDYDNNIETFSIDDKSVPIQDYLELLGEIFGYKVKNINLVDSNDFFIPNLEELRQRYLQIYKTINMDKFTNPKYTFIVGPDPSYTILRDGDEPDWEISPELRKAVLEDMPKDLSLEEQAIYIYCKMCTIFSYDEGYLYRNKINKSNYMSFFSKERLEALQPGDKLTCYDFARAYAKFLNELGEDISAVVLLEGLNEGHALAGFYTDHVSATVDPINIASDGEDATNDLMKAKNGINLKGISIISDRNGIINQAVKKVYPQVLDKQPKSIPEYLQELKSISEEQDVPNDVMLKLQCLLEILKSNNLHGNELTQTLWGVCKSTKYFGDTRLEYAYLGELQKDEKGNPYYARHILLRELNKDKSSDSLKQVFIINSNTLELVSCSEEDIIAKLNSGELIYENEKHKLSGIDKEVVE